MSSDLQTLRTAAYQGNYRRILNSYVAPFERVFVKRRITEELTELRQLNDGEVASAVRAHASLRHV